MFLYAEKIKSVKVAHLHVTVKCRQCLYTFSTKLCVWSAVLNCSFFSLGQLPTDFVAHQHTDARYWYSKSVCPSVRLSVCYVPVSDENGLTYRHSFFHLYGSPIIPVLPASNIFTKFRRGHPLRGIKISRFSANKSLYLATRYRHSYYRRRIGNYTQAFE